MIEVVKMSSKGQIVIPERIRKKLNIDEGTRLVINADESKLMLELEADFEKRMKKIHEKKENAGWTLLAMKGIDGWEEDDFDWGKYYAITK